MAYFCRRLARFELLWPVCAECTYHYFLQNGNHGEEKQPQKNQLAREMKQLDDMATFKQFLSALWTALQIENFLFLNSNQMSVRLWLASLLIKVKIKAEWVIHKLILDSVWLPKSKQKAWVANCPDLVPSNSGTNLIQYLCFLMILNINLLWMFGLESSLPSSNSRDKEW